MNTILLVINSLILGFTIVFSVATLVAFIYEKVDNITKEVWIISILISIFYFISHFIV